MSEIARTDVVEGVIVEATVAPFETADEAAAIMRDAFTLLRQGRDQIQDGHALLTLAEERQAWKVLGFETWKDCVLAGVEQHLRTQIQPEYRRELTVDLRKRYGVSTRAIAQRLGVSHMTSQRDLEKARVTGELVEEEGNTVVSTDGTARPARGKRPRANFRQSWETQATRLMRAMESLTRQREDDRWPANRENLSIKWRSDFSRTLDQFGDLLEDMDTKPEERA